MCKRQNWCYCEAAGQLENVLLCSSDQVQKEEAVVGLCHIVSLLQIKVEQLEKELTALQVESEERYLVVQADTANLQHTIDRLADQNELRR